MDFTINVVCDNDLIDSKPTPIPIKKSPKSAYKFTYEDDINLLKNVILIQPFSNDKQTEKWKEIYDNLKLPVKDYYCIKRHFKMIFGYYKTQRTKSLKSSGTEEEYNEKIQLFDEIKEIMDMHEDTKDKINKKDQEEAKLIRDAAVNSLKDKQTSTIQQKVERKPKGQFKDQVLKIDEDDREYKKLKLDLKEKELEHQRQEFEHRKFIELNRLQLDEKRQEAELKERKLMMDLLLKKLN